MRGAWERWRESEPAQLMRTGWRWVADHPVPGGARWAYVAGSVLVLLLVSQLASGLLLSFDYAPTTDAAHESVSRIMDPEASPWGPLVRGLHHHGASFLVVVLVLHLVQVAWSGAYRKPRRTNWWSGLALGLVILAFAFTGYLLPWDQTAYYATRVGLSIMRSVPIVGPPQADLLQGGPVLGNLTLTRFYAIHVILLPGALVSLVGLHLFLFRKRGVTPPAGLDEVALAARRQPFWPHQALRDVLVMAAAFAVLVAVALVFPAPLGDKADPSVPFEARPEWYFYWLFQLLHYFEPPVEWMGTLVIPGLVVGFLFLLPFLDRSRERTWTARWRPLAALAGVLGVVAILTLQVMLDDAAVVEAGAPMSDAAVAVPVERLVPDTAVRAALLYGVHCTECHGVRGEVIDPDATDLRTEDFSRMLQADFDAMVEHVLRGGEMMPAFEDELTERQARDILRHVVLPFSESGRSEGD